ncbi:mucin-5AC-like isoform X4 [Denticeps clupeoides]|uniref:mucin-5AC-like isoform X4 n=1 Tax=Denticeps clupeoides TaxID=299321 RepID=UPI0010A39ABF|nr:mucin-5AC-like isoform X4 [Denticeps clupeoides]
MWTGHISSGNRHTPAGIFTIAHCHQLHDNITAVETLKLIQVTTGPALGPIDRRTASEGTAFKKSPGSRGQVASASKKVAAPRRYRRCRCFRKKAKTSLSPAPTRSAAFNTSAFKETMTTISEVVQLAFEPSTTNLTLPSCIQTDKPTRKTASSPSAAPEIPSSTTFRTADSVKRTIGTPIHSVHSAHSVATPVSTPSPAPSTESPDVTPSATTENPTSSTQVIHTSKSPPELPEHTTTSAERASATTEVTVTKFTTLIAADAFFVKDEIPTATYSSNDLVHFSSETPTSPISDAESTPQAYTSFSQILSKFYNKAAPVIDVTVPETPVEISAKATSVSSTRESSTATLFSTSSVTMTLEPRMTDDFPVSTGAPTVTETSTPITEISIPDIEVAADTKAFETADSAVSYSPSPANSNTPISTFTSTQSALGKSSDATRKSATFLTLLTARETSASSTLTTPAPAAWTSMPYTAPPVTVKTQAEVPPADSTSGMSRVSSVPGTPLGISDHSPAEQSILFRSMRLEEQSTTTFGPKSTTGGSFGTTTISSSEMSPTLTEVSNVGETTLNSSYIHHGKPTPLDRKATISAGTDEKATTEGLANTRDDHSISTNIDTKLAMAAMTSHSEDTVNTTDSSDDITAPSAGHDRAALPAIIHTSPSITPSVATSGNEKRQTVHSGEATTALSSPKIAGSTPSSDIYSTYTAVAMNLKTSDATKKSATFLTSFTTRELSASSTLTTLAPAAWTSTIYTAPPVAVKTQAEVPPADSTSRMSRVSSVPGTPLGISDHSTASTAEQSILFRSMRLEEQSTTTFGPKSTTGGSFGTTTISSSEMSPTLTEVSNVGETTLNSSYIHHGKPTPLDRKATISAGTDEKATTEGLANTRDDHSISTNIDTKLAMAAMTSHSEDTVNTTDSSDDITAPSAGHDRAALPAIIHTSPSITPSVATSGNEKRQTVHSGEATTALSSPKIAGSTPSSDIYFTYTAVAMNLKTSDSTKKSATFLTLLTAREPSASSTLTTPAPAAWTSMPYTAPPADVKTQEEVPPADSTSRMSRVSSVPGTPLSILDHSTASTAEQSTLFLSMTLEEQSTTTFGPKSTTGGSFGTTTFSSSEMSPTLSEVSTVGETTLNSSYIHHGKPTPLDRKATISAGTDEKSTTEGLANTRDDHSISTNIDTKLAMAAMTSHSEDTVNATDSSADITAPSAGHDRAALPAIIHTSPSITPSVATSGNEKRQTVHSGEATTALSSPRIAGSTPSSDIYSTYTAVAMNLNHVIEHPAADSTSVLSTTISTYSPSIRKDFPASGPGSNMEMR